MLNRTRAVEVHLVPSQATPAQQRTFLRDLVSSVKAERPRFVLDCSRVWEMNTETIHLLLLSLEETMKFNGDVRLASLRPGAESVLRTAGVDRLFEIFTTNEAAAQSFQRRLSSVAMPAQRSKPFKGGTEHAA